MNCIVVPKADLHWKRREHTPSALRDLRCHDTLKPNVSGLKAAIPKVLTHPNSKQSRSFLVQDHRHKILHASSVFRKRWFFCQHTPFRTFLPGFWTIPG
jgi:hypothetical protein